MTAATVDKTMTMAEAAELVPSGVTLGLGGMTLYRRPVAFARALMRRPDRPRNLTLLAFTAGLEADLLVGAGMITRSRTCYFGLESFGLAPHFTRAASLGALTVVEESEASIACGLRARMGRVGFMPSTAWQGTDLFALRPDVRTVVDPYSGETLTAFPAIHCDVAAIHVLKCDRSGNGILGGNPTIDLELAIVAPTVILTAEEVVDHLEGPLDIPGFSVTAVVQAPRGAWPTSCYPLYPLDGPAIHAYVDAANEDRLPPWFDEGCDA